MSAEVVGSAAVEILADLAKFGSESKAGIESGLKDLGPTVEKGLSNAGSSAGKEGESAGREYSEKLSDQTKEGLKALSGAIIGGLGVASVGELAEKSLEAADALEGANIKIEGSFGDSADAVKDWAGTMAVKLGQSAADAENTAGTFGQMFHSMGVSQTAAAGMSEKLDELVQNVARFNNADPASVQSAFTAAMRGRGKALSALGINLDNTTIASEAVTHGLVKMQVSQTKVASTQDAYNAAVAAQAKVDKTATSTSAERKAALDKVNAAHLALSAALGGSLPTLTASQKGEAAYYAILDGTKNQENAVADSSHTLAQQKKILTAEVQNLLAKMGGALLPILTRVSEYITGHLLPAVHNLSQWFQRDITPYLIIFWNWFSLKILPVVQKITEYILTHFIPTVKAVTAWIVANKPTVLTLVAILGSAAVAWGLWTAAIAAWELVTKIATAVQLAFNAVLDANPIMLVVVAIAALAAGAVYAYTHFKVFHDIINDVGSILTAVWNDVLKPVVNFFMKDWKLALDIALGPVGLLITNFQTVKDVVGDVINAITGLPKDISNLVGSITAAGESLISGLWDGVKSGVSTAVSAAGGFVEDLGKDVVNGIIRTLNFALDLPLKVPRFNTHIPGIGTIGGETLLPAIPTLAQGATVNPQTGGTLAILAEAGRPESVVDTGLMNQHLAASARALNGDGATAAMLAEISAKLDQLRNLDTPLSKVGPAVATGLDVASRGAAVRGRNIPTGKLAFG